MTFNDDFCVIYTNPFGDIKAAEGIPISFSSDNFKSSVEINKDSGLITSNPVVSNEE